MGKKIFMNLTNSPYYTGGVIRTINSNANNTNIVLGSNSLRNNLINRLNGSKPCGGCGK